MPTVTLSPGDEIEVKFFYAPELNESQTIRPDGRITLQLVGEVVAHGKTPDELSAELVELYTPQLKKPEVSVIVRSLAENRVYVGGEVKEPGMIQIKDRLTALEAVMLAGGFEPRTAAVQNVVIVRHKNNQRYGCALDFRGALKGQEVKAFYLEPRDIVFVPRTTIAKVNLWIDQYINRMVPRTGLSYFVPLGAGTIGVDTATTVTIAP